MKQTTDSQDERAWQQKSKTQPSVGTLNTGKNAKCKYCDAVLKYYSSTSSMMYHLKTWHPTIALQGEVKQRPPRKG